MFKNKNIFLLLIFILNGCDLTPRVNLEIYKAQKLLEEQRYNETTETYLRILKGDIDKELRVKIILQLADIYSIYLSDYKNANTQLSDVKRFTTNPIWLIKAEEKLGDLNLNYLKDYKVAIENYKNLKSFIPRLEKSDFYEYSYALSLLQDGQIDKAILEFNEIIKDPNHEFYLKGLFNLGLANFELQNWQSAISYMKEYIKRETRKDNVVQAKFVLANALENLEELKKAYNMYYSILSDYPNIDVIKNRLKSIYKRRVARKR